jgi:hypothetical protein
LEKLELLPPELEEEGAELEAPDAEEEPELVEA